MPPKAEKILADYWKAKQELDQLKLAITQREANLKVLNEIHSRYLNPIIDAANEVYDRLTKQLKKLEDEEKESKKKQDARKQQVLRQKLAAGP